MLLSALYERADVKPSSPALLFIKRATFVQFTYRDLLIETERWARRYVAAELPRDGIVAIVLDHRIDAYGAFLGAMRAGLVPTFLPYPTPKQDPARFWAAQSELLERVRPVCIVSSGIARVRLEELVRASPCAIVDVDHAWQEHADAATLAPLSTVEAPERVALLQHSSGTTGAKKGVALTYALIGRQAAALAEALPAREEDRTISWLPLCHDMGLFSAFLIPVSIGSSIIALDAFEWLARPAIFFEYADRFRATHAWLPNFALNHLARTYDDAHAYDISWFQTIINASEPCKPETVELFCSTFARHGLERRVVRTLYGMAESVFATTITASGAVPRRLAIDAQALAERGVAIPPVGKRVKYLSCGVALPGMEVCIFADEGRNVGEIGVRGEYLFAGYYKNSEATAAAIDAEGWYRTGDIGFFHDGELFVCGRKKDVIIVHGRNYYAADIEAIVSSVPGVKPGRAVAIGRYDDVTASEEAYVLAESAAQSHDERLALERTIKRAVFGALGVQIHSARVVGFGELVKTTSGKLSRAENAALYERERFALQS